MRNKRKIKLFPDNSSWERNKRSAAVHPERSARIELLHFCTTKLKGKCYFTLSSVCILILCELDCVRLYIPERYNPFNLVWLIFHHRGAIIKRLGEMRFKKQINRFEGNVDNYMFGKNVPQC